MRSKNERTYFVRIINELNGKLCEMKNNVRQQHANLCVESHVCQNKNEFNAPCQNTPDATLIDKLQVMIFGVCIEL